MAKFHKNIKTLKHKNKREKAPLSLKIEINEQIFQETLKKRRSLMWLGVVFSSVIIVALWFCSWQFKAPALSSQPVINNGQLENLAKDLGQTMAEIKGSLANINQAIGQTNSNELTNNDQAEEKLKEGILNAIKKNEETASSTNKNIFQ